MPTTLKQDMEFAKEMTSLEDAIEWISKNLNPDDVFEDAALAAWAESNGYKEEE